MGTWCFFASFQQITCCCSFCGLLKPSSAPPLVIGGGGGGGSQICHRNGDHIGEQRLELPSKCKLCKKGAGSSGVCPECTKMYNLCSFCGLALPGCLCFVLGFFFIQFSTRKRPPSSETFPVFTSTSWWWWWWYHTTNDGFDPTCCQRVGRKQINKTAPILLRFYFTFSKNGCSSNS